MAGSQAQLDAALTTLASSVATLSGTEAGLVTVVTSLSQTETQLVTAVNALIAKLPSGTAQDLSTEIAAVAAAQGKLDGVNADAATQIAGLGTAESGLSAAEAAAQSALNPVPSVTGLAPATGPAAGGTAVVVSGAKFTGASGVLFGTVNAASFANDPSNPDGSITAVSPAQPAGVVDVTVVGPSGTSAIVGADKYTVV